MFGWLQRRQRLFYAVGIIVLIVSLGAVFFGGQLGPAGPAASPEPTAEATADAAASDAADGEDAGEGGESGAADATPTEEATAAPTPDADGVLRTYSAPPAMEIDPANRYEAIIRTERGNIRVELLPGEAPGYVNNFVFLARNGFYEGLTFHRVIAGFVAQGGDPTGTGAGGPGYHLAEETNARPFDAGVLSMAKSNTVSGSQFFITLEPTPHLAADFTVFGVVTEGLDVARSLTLREPGPGVPPGDRILRIDITEIAAPAEASDDGEDAEADDASEGDEATESDE